MNGITKVQFKEVTDDHITLYVEYKHKTPYESPAPFTMAVVVMRRTDEVVISSDEPMPTVVTENVQRVFGGKT